MVEFGRQFLEKTVPTNHPRRKQVGHSLWSLSVSTDSILSDCRLRDRRNDEMEEEEKPWILRVAEALRLGPSRKPAGLVKDKKEQEDAALLGNKESGSR